MDEAAWGALTLALTALGGIYTWFALRRRGLVAGMRGAGITLIPLALLLTDTLKMVTRIGTAVSDWALHLAFDPFVWAGLVLAGVSVVLFVVAGFLDRRQQGGAPPTRRRDRAAAPKALPATGRPASSPVVSADPELDEIEALLRKHGIA